jgi:hypothetical protein
MRRNIRCTDRGVDRNGSGGRAWGQVQSRVHHVNVMQSSEARLLDALAGALPRPGPKCCRIAGRAGQTIGAATNDQKALQTPASLDAAEPH